MRPFLGLVLLGCTSGSVDPNDTGEGDTGAGDTSDTGTDSDTSSAAVEVFGVRGTATIDGDAWTGTTTVYDEVRDGTTEVLCTLDFASTGEPATTEVPCPDCLFAFEVTHAGPAVRTGPMCDSLWPDTHPGTHPAFWDAVLGYDPSGWNDGPCLMLYVDAFTDSQGTFHEATWEKVPRADHPDGGATFDEATGLFTFDDPISTTPWGVD